MASRPTRTRRPPPKHQQEPESWKPPPKRPLDSQTRAKWTTTLTRVLADLMVDQVHKGNKQKSSFNKKAWKYLCDEFHERTGLKWDRDQLKNRFSALRKLYIITKSILDEEDFKWDEPTGVIIASNEAWNTYIKEHPDAETVRSTGCPIYKQLCKIFAEPELNGKENGSAEQDEGTPGVPCPRPLSMFHEVESSQDSEETADIADEQDKVKSNFFSRNSCCKRGRRGVNDVIANALSEMAAASKLRAEAIKKCNERYSITDCVRVLDELQGVDERDYFTALDLFNNRNARETFLSLKVDKRLTWLQSKCSPLFNRPVEPSLHLITYTSQLGNSSW